MHSVYHPLKQIMQYHFMLEVTDGEVPCGAKTLQLFHRKLFWQSYSKNKKVQFLSHSVYYLSERWCVKEDEYIEWMAAMKLACRGRTMADMPGYQAELHALRSLLRLHHNCPSPSPASSPLSAADGGGGTDKSVAAVRIADLVAARHLNRLRHKQVRFTTWRWLEFDWLIDWLRWITTFV